MIICNAFKCKNNKSISLSVHKASVQMSSSAQTGVSVDVKAETGASVNAPVLTGNIMTGPVIIYGSNAAGKGTFSLL